MHVGAVDDEIRRPQTLAEAAAAVTGCRPFEHAVDEFLDEIRMDAAPVSTRDGLQDAPLGAVGH